MKIEGHSRGTALAATRAKELNLPWDNTTVTVGRPLFGRFTGVQHVSSRIVGDNAIITLAVRQSTGEVWPVQALYPGPHRGVDVAFLARRVACGVVCGGAVFWGATTWLNIQASQAVVAAILAAVGGAIASVRIEPTLGA